MAKYDSLRKTEKARMIVDYARQHPDLSHREVGQVFGLTRSRISQILQAAKNTGHKPE